jgi:GNAT superfamily N-acetyltransferase
MSDIQIRTATPADAKSIQGLLVELGYSLSENEVQKNMAALAEDPKSKILLAVENNIPIGLVTIAWRTILHYPAPIARITGFVVTAEQRGKGIGHKLLAAAEKLAQENGCLYIELTTNMRRTEAHGFYARAGYEQTSFRFRKQLS